MKAIFEKVPLQQEEVCVVEVIRGNSFGCTWHFHPEYELTLTIKGHGHRIVGDNISNLERGDLVFIGPNLSHDWQADPSEVERSVHAIVIQFREDFPGSQSLGSPVFEPMRRLFSRSRVGLRITGRTRDKIAWHMKRMSGEYGLRRFIHLLTVLDVLAHSGECQPICSPSFNPVPNLYDQKRMNRICRYLNANLEKRSRVREIASRMHLSEGTLSRYFRSRTGKSFPKFINELRIGRACRMLAQENLSITEIAFACGFQNLSNFNRQFLKLKKVCPREYRRKLLDQV